MNILITGATGFIGQHLLELIDFENYRTSILTRNPEKKTRLSFDAVTKIKGDLTDLHSLIAATKEIDVIINIAAEVRNQDKLEITNIQGVKNLVEAAKLNGVKKIIHISSVGVVGKQYNFNYELVNEKTFPTPQNGYERTKLESEKILLDSSNSIPTVILRPTNVYGEFHPFNAVLSLTNFIKKNKFILTTKKARLNYVYVKDVCQTIIKTIQSDKYNGNIINVGESENFSDFTQKIADEFGIKLKVIFIPSFIFQLLESIRFKKLRSISNAIEYDCSTFQKIVSTFEVQNNGIRETIQYFKNQKLIE